MKIKSALSSLVLGAIILTLSGCDSGGPSAEEFAASLDCLSIAGDYNTPIELAGNKENMAISIESNCTFATRSPSTGESYGKLTPAENSKYTGTGRSPACGGGPFSVYIEGSNLFGMTFAAQCNS